MSVDGNIYKKLMELKRESLCVHTKKEDNIKNQYGAIATPIFQTATFAHPGIGMSTGYDYVRESNPTRHTLETMMTNLEKCYDTVATSSGMAALGIALELIDNGAHIICSEDLYGGSVRMFENIRKKRALSFSYVDTSDINKLREAIKAETKVLYIETPSNPTMQVSDLSKIRGLADEFGLLLMVDNTFLTPYFQNPFDFGADIVIHSGTKFLSGHNDVLAGFLCVNSKELSEKMRFIYKTVGSCLSPIDSYFLIRGIKTLALRMERANENAMKLAEYLKQHKKVEKVYYTGLEDNPSYEISKKQTRGFGSMISFKTYDEESARKVLERVELIQYAESLGGVESLITFPMIQTHADVEPHVRERLGIDGRFLRFSVGIENVDDLIADLEQALA